MRLQQMQGVLTGTAYQATAQAAQAVVNKGTAPLASLLARVEIPKPSVYDGRITKDAVENWILEIQRWQKNQAAWRWRSHHILEENKISLTGQYTSGVALQWWTEHEKRLLKGDPLSKYTTLDKFLLGIRASFTPKNIQEERWRKFDNLKQVTSAQEFSYKLTA